MDKNKYNNYNNTYSPINMQFWCFAACKALQDELYRKILDSLLDFTRKCASTRQQSDWPSQMRASEIPTAALILGTLLAFPFLLNRFRWKWITSASDLFMLWKSLWRCCHVFPTGVNVPDHDMTFQSLSELLQQSVSPFVASVQAKECGGEEADEKINKEGYKYEWLCRRSCRVTIQRTRGKKKYIVAERLTKGKKYLPDALMEEVTAPETTCI